MIGVNASMPKAPRLVTVKVPPRISSAFSLSLTGPLDQVARSVGNFAQAQRLHVAQHRHDEAFIQFDRDADVNRLGDDDLLVYPRCIEQPVLVQGGRGELDDHVRVARHEVIAGLDRRLGLGAKIDEIAGIDSGGERDWGRGVMAVQHVLGDGAAHRTHRLRR